MRRRPFTRPVLMLASASFALAACVVGWDSGPRANDSAEDAGSDDASARGEDDGSAVDDAGVTFFAFDDEASWEDHPLDGAFAGAAFDGRYVYFVPQGHVTLWRFDTTMGFADAEAWTSVDLPTLDSGAGTSGFRGAAVANGKLYVGPADARSSLALEYAPADPLVPASFRAFDLAALDSLGGLDMNGDRPHASVVVHGGFVYFVPAKPNGTLIRYDPQYAFDNAKGWSSVRLPWQADAGAFSGSVSTSAGVYLVPSLGRMFAVFDGGAFVPANFATGSAVIGDFFGAATDGAQIYFAPRGRPVTVSYAVGSSLLGSKKDPPSFALDGFAKCTIACFGGAVFDGRYLYFVPRNHARFVRYDTQAPQPFEDALSWAVGRPDAGATSFFGGAFDGRYVYFVPDDAGRVVRFHAREPAAMPAAYSGSFL